MVRDLVAFSPRILFSPGGTYGLMFAEGKVAHHTFSVTQYEKQKIKSSWEIEVGNLNHETINHYRTRMELEQDFCTIEPSVRAASFELAPVRLTHSTRGNRPLRIRGEEDISLARTTRCRPRTLLPPPPSRPHALDPRLAVEPAFGTSFRRVESALRRPSVVRRLRGMSFAL